MFQNAIIEFIRDTGYYRLFTGDGKSYVMILISLLLIYLAIVKKFEPLLLIPIAFGMLVTNLPGVDIFHEELFASGHIHWDMFQGCIVGNTADLVSAAQYAVNAAGSIVSSAGETIGTITSATITEISHLNSAGAVVSDASGKILAESATFYFTGAGVYISDGAVYSATNVLLAGAGHTISVGLLDVLYLGIKLGIYPCLIFMGVGAMTDFGPMISNPKTLLLGAAAQLGIFLTFLSARWSGLFTFGEAGSIGIIGGADGPTAIFVASRLAPWLLGPIAVAAYSYMALVPMIQPPIMRALTTKEERRIVMKPLRPVSKREKIFFSIACTIFVALLVPSAGTLVACLMLGNLFRECGVVERLSKTVQNELINIVTIFLGVSVGATATGATFLSIRTLAILGMGIIAFCFGTAGGVLLAKFMNLFLKEKINPLIGSAGVSAVPMAARVSQVVGQEDNPGNFLLMHAMGPNVSGVIGTAIAAGVIMALFG